MAKLSEVICWIGVGVVALAMIVYVFTRGLSSFLAVVLIFVHSPLPWWILTPAAVAVVAGTVYLFKSGPRRIKPNRKFTN